ncbi:MAG: ATP-binding cassette domain-containing protein [Eubacteriales bacterium]|nr:ATP-binding cassette domain-containing protein [Eubacteriales bacterium]
MKELKHYILVYFFLLKLTWRASKRLVLVLLGTGLSQVFRLLINVLIPKLLIDGLAAGLGFKDFILWGAFLLFSNVVLARVPAFALAYVQSSFTEVSDHFSYFMAEQVMAIDFAYMEDKKYIGLKEQADFMLTFMRPHINMLKASIDFMKAAGIVVSVLAIALSFSLPLLLILVLLLVIQIWQGKKSVQAVQSYVQALKSFNAKIIALVRFAFHPEKQMDGRIFCRKSFFADRYYDVTVETLAAKKAVDHRRGLSLSIIAALNILGQALCYAYTGIRTVSDLLGPQITLGSFAMYVSALTQFNANFVELSLSLMSLSHAVTTAEPIYEFMHLPLRREKLEELTGGSIEAVNRKEDSVSRRSMQGQMEFLELPEQIEELSFEHVYFKYPTSQDYVLKDFSVSFKRGQKISIVGLNGAGKTTVVKLLMKLYTPLAGKIKLNGIDIRNFDTTEYQAKMSVIFQDYKLFNLSVAENIACVKNYDAKRVSAELAEVGLTEAVAKLKYGVDSVLGKDFSEDGVQLSGGERQKIAIARALYKNAEVVILDEPTSALDPKSEAEIYENFHQLTKNKTAIFISHRLSSSLFCDKILLLRDGRVEDFDTHEKLMEKKDSLYYKMFTTQQENYLYD